MLVSQKPSALIASRAETAAIALLLCIEILPPYLSAHAPPTRECIYFRRQLNGRPLQSYPVACLIQV